MAGIAFEEILAGSFRPLAASTDGASRPFERPMAITIRGRLAPLRARAAIEGEVDIEGLADHRRLEGALDLGGLLGGVVAYTFTFPSNDGAACTFDGRRTLALGGPVTSFSTLPGVVRDAHGAELGRALLRFDVQRDLLRYLRSLRAWR